MLRPPAGTPLEALRFPDSPMEHSMNKKGVA
jgi:hypothetical protein